jgi:hypothetical protein
MHKQSKHNKKANKDEIFLANYSRIYYICTSKKLRGGAVVARWAHNPKVGGSNPPSATKKKPWRESAGVFCFQTRQELALVRGWKQKIPELCKAQRGFSLLSNPLEDHERSE